MSKKPTHAHTRAYHRRSASIDLPVPGGPIISRLVSFDRCSWICRTSAVYRGVTGLFVVVPPFS